MNELKSCVTDAKRWYRSLHSNVQQLILMIGIIALAMVGLCLMGGALLYHERANETVTERLEREREERRLINRYQVEQRIKAENAYLRDLGYTPTY